MNTSFIKINFLTKIVIMLLLLFTFPIDLVFSTGYKPDPSTATFDGTGTLSNSIGRVLNNAMGFFRSGYMRAVCTIVLGALGVGMIMNRGEPGMVKKFIPWAVGIAIILGLSALMDIMWPH